MWRSKKFIIIAVLSALVLVGCISGVVFAQTGTTETTSDKTLFARVATILGIDQSKLEGAFKQAQSDMQQEAMDNYLKSLVEQGKITQEQADQYKNWWQSKPDVPMAPGFRGNFGRHCGFRGPGIGFRGTDSYQGLPGTPTPQTVQ